LDEHGSSARRRLSYLLEVRICANFIQAKATAERDLAIARKRMKEVRNG
jgi:hypothetical protein